MKKWKPSKIFIVLSIYYNTQFSFADIVSSDSSNTNVYKKDKNNIEIINIAAPSASGLSYNQYSKYNVDVSGVVLNNAQTDIHTQLAGNISANPHLTQASANIILNEVVSKDPSKLLGKQEIAGKIADYILVNPNGMSCDGCGFINISNASLVVGNPNITDGVLKGYRIDGSHNISTTKDISAEKTNLNLIAPVVNIKGNIKGKDYVNIITGHNEINVNNDQLSISVLPNKGKVLDGKIAGSIQANRIRIHSTDNRATLDIETGQLKGTNSVYIGAGNLKVHGHIDTKNNNKNKNKYVLKSTSQEYQASMITGDDINLNITNQLTINAANLTGKNIVLKAAKSQFGTEKTLNKHYEKNNRSSGSWYHNNETSKEEEINYVTSIKGDNVGIVADQGAIDGQSLKITAQNTTLYGKQGVTLRGTQNINRNEKVEKFKNETSNLTTGKKFNKNQQSQYIASELDIKGNLKIGGGDIKLSGVKVRTGGDFLVKNTGSTTVNAENILNSNNIDNYENYWGGIGGSNTVKKNESITLQQGADLVINGKTYIDSEKGVKISGSRLVSGKEALVRAHKGRLVIDDVKNEITSLNVIRKGTVLDITKASAKDFKQNSVSRGSTVKSESNLKLVSDAGDIEVAGSLVKSLGDLIVKTDDKSNLYVKGGQNIMERESEKSGLTTKGNLDTSLGIDTVKNIAVSVTGEVLPDLMQGKIDNLQEKVLDGIKKAVSDESVSAHTDLISYSEENKSEKAVTHSASRLEGNNVRLEAGNVELANSKVIASNDADIKANTLKTTAEYDVMKSTESQLSVSLSDTVTAKLTGVTNQVAWGIQYSDINKTQSIAQTSSIQAGHDVNLNTQHSTHVGSNINAGHNVNETAKSIEHLAAKNESIEKKTHGGVSLALDVGLHAENGISTKLGIQAGGGDSERQVTTNQVTQITARNNINSQSEKLIDQGTQYRANGDITLNSEEHKLSAVEDKVTTSGVNAGINVGVSVSTADFAKYDVGANINGSYGQESTSSTKVQGAEIKGANVNINTTQLESQATDITAVRDLKVKADSAKFTQATDTQHANGIKVSVEVGGEVSVIPPSAITPKSLTAGLGIDGHGSEVNQAVTGHLKGDNVSIETKNAFLQGTTIDAKNKSLSGTVITEQAHSSSHAISGNFKANFDSQPPKLSVDAKMAIR
uniref:HhdA n=1 Tax=Haemophilus ducreyi TaxID=730 RepID=Q47955_HAEDC|nr:HhdA precursor [[Haemophilus] ducreyi]prf//2204380B hemolysin [[Haemophilus] ducreyi]